MKSHQIYPKFWLARIILARARAQNILPPMPKKRDFWVFTAMSDWARAARGSARAPNFYRKYPESEGGFRKFSESEASAEDEEDLRNPPEDEAVFPTNTWINVTSVRNSTSEIRFHEISFWKFYLDIWNFSSTHWYVAVYTYGFNWPNYYDMCMPSAGTRLYQRQACDFGK